MYSLMMAIYSRNMQLFFIKDKVTFRPWFYTRSILLYMYLLSYWPDHELDDRGIVVWFPGRSWYLFYCPKRPGRLWGPPLLLFSERRVKAAQAWSWSFTRSSIAVKNVWICTFVPPCSYLTPTWNTLPVFVVPRVRFSCRNRGGGCNLQCHGKVSSHLCSLQSFLGLI